MPTPYLYALDNSNNIWQISISDSGILSSLELPSGAATPSPVLSFNVPNVFSTSFQLSLASAPIIDIVQIAYSPLYPLGLEIDSQNFQWAISAQYVSSAWKLSTAQIGPSGMTRGDIIATTYGYTENRQVLRTYMTWLDLEISTIIHRQRYWWRKKTADFLTYPRVPNYNMNANGIAPDMEQIVDLVELRVGRNPRQLGYIGEAGEVQDCIANTTRSGQPCGYLLVPGALQTIRLEPIPNAQYPMRVMYWSGFNPQHVPESQLDQYRNQVIPLIPPSFHHVVLLAYQRRSFLMLYGKTDSRFQVINNELFGPDGESGAMGDLDRYNQPSVQAVENFASRDPEIYVSSART